MSGELVAAIASGCAGYVFVPIWQVSVIAGEWLARRWSDERLPFAATLNTIVIALVLLVVDVTAMGQIIQSASGEGRGRAASGGFILGALGYIVLGRLEYGIRQKRKPRA